MMGGMASAAPPPPAAPTAPTAPTAPSAAPTAPAASAAPAVRRRDAAKSRAALLAVAERQFSEHGFAGVSLEQIGAAAGLSRGTPSYFFGSKEGLYRAVLDQVFAGRDAATRAALAPLVAWSEDRDGDDAGLRRALTHAVTEYLAFLLGRPAFVRLIGWEDLAGGARLRDARPTASSVMADAFAALRRTGRRRGTAPFAPDDAVLLFVALTFSLRANHDTFLAGLGRDLADPGTRRRHVALVVDQLLHLVARPRRS
jgi:TetR/AcrR family transcriptional regulator